MKVESKSSKTMNYIVVLIILISIISIVGCSKETPDTGDKISDTKSNNTVSPPSEDIKEYSKLLKIESEGSFHLISSALENGDIDKNTAALYNIYTISGDDNLPEKFRSEKLGSNANSKIFQIISEFDSYSDETKQKLAPFLKRPNEEGSYLNLKYQNKDPKTSMFIESTYANRVDSNIYTDFLISADKKIKIWYPNVKTTTKKVFGGTGNLDIEASVAKQMAEKTKKFVDESKMMKRFEDLMKRKILSDGTKGGDDKLDIYIAPAGDSLGVTRAEHGTPTPSYIFINTAIGTNRDDVLKTTIAHELFHSFQYAYNYDVIKDNWWGEATSVWAEDYIYSATNSEQPRLDNFIYFPHITLYQENPPHDHHYSAYIFAFFLTKSINDDLMRKIWDGCDGGKCIDAIDDNIEGGLKEQWKKFVLWNYNKTPVKYYTDKGGFPPISSGDSSKLKETEINKKEIEVTISSLKPLSAEIHENLNKVKDDKYKRITFRELNNFTNKSENAGIKAIIYFKNGQTEVEDWTELKKRSFCLENPDENFERITLFFSNAEKKKEISETKIKIKVSESCYRIDQEDNTAATIHFPYVDGGVYKKVDINTDIFVVSEGETLTGAEDGQEFAYLTKWRLNHEFEQEKQAFTISCMGDNSIDYGKGWITRSAGYLDFDLTGLKEGDSFPMDLTYGLKHPNGNYEEVPDVFVNCVGISIASTIIDLSGYSGKVEGIYQATIYEMTEDSAKILVDNSCLYNSCTMQDGDVFQTMGEAVILEISKD